MYKKHIKLALRNIIEYGDTDIFPFPIENYVFKDHFEESIKLLEGLHKEFDEFIARTPSINIDTLSAVGYTGFRWVTLVDPIWNAYFLSLVLSITEDIERIRIAKNKEVVHSYRFEPDYNNGSLFDKNFNWFSFQKKSLELCQDETSKFNYVVICDVSDFYNRVYHHPIKNALLQIIPDNHKVDRIDNIMFSFSKNKSYGLPVGGPAARILAELSLNNTDKILQLEGIKFTRFVDDIHIFANSLEEAHRNLNFLATKLINIGLTLQKNKTQILTTSEFMRVVNARIKAESDDEKTKERAKFMALPIKYDPYSATATEDYQRIKGSLEKFDIMGLLNEELRKTRIHQQFGKRLLNSFRALDENIVSQSFIAISSRIKQLYPIFPNLMISAYSNFGKLNITAKETIQGTLRELVKEDSYITNIELNAAYLSRVLGKEYSDENEAILGILYKKFSDSPLVRSRIMRIVTNWKLQHWLQDFKNKFQTMSKWERKIFIVASYFMKDEGKHWRDHHKDNFSKEELLIRDWASKKINEKNWTMPI